MAEEKNLPYQRDALVYLSSGENKIRVFENLISSSGFITNLYQVFQVSGKNKDDFCIVIKPNIMDAAAKETEPLSYTDPELVELLIDRIVKEGYKKIFVAETENIFNYKYSGRTVEAVSKMVGYSEKNYMISDLGNDKIFYDYGSVLGKHSVGRIWGEADYRISFTKNKTDWDCFYCGCLKNLLGCLPEWDKIKHYYGPNIEFYEACVLMADRFPVNFGFIDAWTSGNGFSSSVKTPKSQPTRTLFASENILALDWVQGEKMDFNPSVNPVLQEAMLRWGTVKIIRKGNMTPWEGWKNIRSYSVAVFGLIDEHYFIYKHIIKFFTAKTDKRFSKK